jgi:hypothetical protein
MMQFLRTLRFMPALVVALVAMFVAVSASAYASTSSYKGPTAHAAKRHKHKKHKKRRHHSSSIPGPAGPQGPAGAPGSTAPSTTPQGFEFREVGTIGMDPGLEGTVIGQLSLPAGGKYQVTANAELGNNAATANSVSCQLLENFNPLTGGSVPLAPEATFNQTISLSATSQGGNVKLVCTPDKSAQARNRVIDAIKVA